jgi:hypothetical protein
MDCIGAQPLKRALASRSTPKSGHRRYLVLPAQFSVRFAVINKTAPHCYTSGSLKL